MFSQSYYLLRSRNDGQYLVAKPEVNPTEPESSYLLMFGEYSDALSYLNTHGSQIASHFAVESISANQLKAVLQRWGFKGVGMVEDPLVPQVRFLTHDS